LLASLIISWKTIGYDFTLVALLVATI